MRDPNGALAQTIIPILNLTDPLFNRIRWEPANGVWSDRSTYDTSLPEGDFVGINGYSAPTKGTTGQSEDPLSYYQDYSMVDVRLAEASGNMGQYRLIQDARHMQGAVHRFMRAWFYGNPATNIKEFRGLSARYGAKFGATATHTAENIVLGGADAGQTDSTSIWILNMGRMGGVAGIYQKDTVAGLKVTNKSGNGTYTDTNSSGAKGEFLLTHYGWSCGQKLPDWRRCVRIANIDTSTLTAAGNGSKDTDLMAKIRWAVDLLPPDAEGETVIVGNRLVSQWLNQQALTTMRTSSNLTFETIGGKAIMMVAGLPFLRSDSITSAETAMATS